MTLGAVVIPVVALAVCGGVMWFAWRLVEGAARDQAGEAERPPPQRQPAHVRRGVTGPAIALAVTALGFGGIALVAGRAVGMETPLLFAGALAVGLCLLGVVLIWVLSRRRRR